MKRLFLLATGALALLATTAAPVNSALPTISGSTIVGSTLTATQGTWSGTGNTYAYAWQRCNATGACRIGRSSAALSWTRTTSKTSRLKLSRPKN